MWNLFSYFTRSLCARARRHFDRGATNLIEHKNSVIFRRGRDKQLKMNDDESIFPEQVLRILKFQLYCDARSLILWVLRREKLLDFFGWPLNLIIICLRGFKGDRAVPKLKVCHRGIRASYRISLYSAIYPITSANYYCLVKCYAYVNTVNVRWKFHSSIYRVLFVMEREVFKVNFMFPQ